MQLSKTSQDQAHTRALPQRSISTSDLGLRRLICSSHRDAVEAQQRSGTSGGLSALAVPGTQELPDVAKLLLDEATGRPMQHSSTKRWRATSATGVDRSPSPGRSSSAAARARTGPGRRTWTTSCRCCVAHGRPPTRAGRCKDPAIDEEMTHRASRPGGCATAVGRERTPPAAAPGDASAGTVRRCRSLRGCARR